MAVDKARKLAMETNRPIYTVGPLIHNQQMVDQLRKDGVVEAAKPESVSDGILLVRAHGISPQYRKTLREKAASEIVDATCPDVAKIHAAIKKYARMGYYTIIFGDAGHAEVEGLLGCSDGRGFVVGRPEDVDKLPEIHPVCLVSQSTQFPMSYEKVAAAVRHRFPDAKALFTICESTTNRQRELFEIARMVDVIVVVGGAHSANTMRLVQLARTLKPTFHIQTSEQLDPREFAGFRTVGLTAGASTPAFIIEDVKKRLEEMSGDQGQPSRANQLR